jgi:hypothetical protein
MALARHYSASSGREEAAVGSPVWSPPLWLKQILDDDSIDSAGHIVRMHCYKNGAP